MSRKKYNRLKKHHPELKLVRWENLTGTYRHSIHHVKERDFVADRAADLLANAGHPMTKLWAHSFVPVGGSDMGFAVDPATLP
jgi:hypothetical protein